MPPPIMRKALSRRRFAVKFSFANAVFHSAAMACLCARNLAPQVKKRKFLDLHS